MGSLDTGIIGPVLPSIEQSFNLTSRESSWIFTLFVIFFMIGSPVMAKFSDFYGRKKIFILDVKMSNQYKKSKVIEKISQYFQDKDCKNLYKYGCINYVGITKDTKKTIQK